MQAPPSEKQKLKFSRYEIFIWDTKYEETNEFEVTLGFEAFDIGARTNARGERIWEDDMPRKAEFHYRGLTQAQVNQLKGMFAAIRPGITAQEETIQGKRTRLGYTYGHSFICYVLEEPTNTELVNFCEALCHFELVGEQKRYKLNYWHMIDWLKYLADSDYFQNLRHIYETTSQEVALHYAKSAICKDYYLYALGYLAGTGELPAEGSSKSGAAAGFRADLIDLKFAFECYLLVSKDSEYYKKAQFQAAMILLGHLENYEAGDEKENALKQLMDLAVNSEDMEMIVRAYKECSGIDIDIRAEDKIESIAAKLSDVVYFTEKSGKHSVSSLLYQFAVRERGPAAAVSPAIASPVREAMGGAGAGASTDAAQDQ